MHENRAEVPEIVVRRLPLYARALHWLAQDNVPTISSSELGLKLGMSSAQIRKDLSYFGEFGKQGTGYDVKFLLSQLQLILGMQREWLVALVGVGDLGHAIAHYGGFGRRGFKIAALFDMDPKKIGQQVGELQILGTESLPMVVRGLRIRLGIIAVPAGAAQGGRRPDDRRGRPCDPELCADQPHHAQGRPGALHRPGGRAAEHDLPPEGPAVRRTRDGGEDHKDAKTRRGTKAGGRKCQGHQGEASLAPTTPLCGPCVLCRFVVPCLRPVGSVSSVSSVVSSLAPCFRVFRLFRGSAPFPVHSVLFRVFRGSVPRPCPP